ncbi:MAG: alkaline phosphatase [Capsulimonas sp.]|nr:alkaline phosphatase [Capsulimonas sp.]
MEHLENRLLMRAPRPVQIATAFLDNRGQAFFTVSVALDPTTLSRKTASILTAGTDGVFGTADDVRLYTSVGYRKGRLTLNANVPLNTKYRVRLNASVIKDVNGLALDGEFKAGKPSGNGFAGGNYDVVSATPTKTVARYSTSAGFINMRLFGSTKPITVANFMHYMNEGAWDTTFFHRSAKDFVIQGGGFNVGTNNVIGSVHSEGDIQNEPGISNLRGTVAMARRDDNNPATTADINSATNQWFFNLSNSNTFLNSSNGGFTVFGQVLDDGSLQVMDAIAAIGTVNASSINSAFDTLPVKDAPAVIARGSLNPAGDLILVTRIAQLFDIAATPNVQAHAASVANASAAAPVSSATVFAAKREVKTDTDENENVLA